MSTTTTDYYIKPGDGWVQVATAADTNVIKGPPRDPWALYAGASPPSTSDTLPSAVLAYSGQPATTNTITIGGHVYTFKTALTPTAGEILIGVDADTSYANLVAALTHGAGSGTTYAAGTLPFPSSVQSLQDATGNTVTFSVSAANGAVSVAETLANASFNGAATSLTGGAPAPRGMAFGLGGLEDGHEVALPGVDGNIYVRLLTHAAQFDDTIGKHFSVIAISA